MEASEIKLKKCWNCFKVKHETEFYLRKKGEPKRQTRCKACNTEVVAAWRNRRHKERLYGTSRN